MTGPKTGAGSVKVKIHLIAGPVFGEQVISSAAAVPLGQASRLTSTMRIP